MSAANFRTPSVVAYCPACRGARTHLLTVKGPFCAACLAGARPLVTARESETVVDWSRVCGEAECRRFPNRCDHIGVRVLHLRVGLGPCTGQGGGA